MDSLLKAKLEKLECHFTWDLGHYQNELQKLKRNMDRVDQKKITSPVHFYNLLGFIQKALGSDREALDYLQKAESVIEKEGTEVLLQVNKANLAWVHFYLGELEKCKACLKELEELQQTHPAPPGCSLHPEVSGEKGWTLVKFNMSKTHQAIDYFKMALEAEPERKEWHKGLAIAMSKSCKWYKCSPEQRDEIFEQVKKAAEINPDDLFLQSLYILRKCEVQEENVDEEVQSLLERSVSTVNLDGLTYIIEYFKGVSIERAIEEAEKVLKMFPNSAIALRILANVYKCKVFSMKEDSTERQNLAWKLIELFEKVVRHYPECVKTRSVLATLHCFAHNLNKADEIYEELLSEVDDFPPHTQQFFYYSYACYLHHYRQLRNESTFT